VSLKWILAVIMLGLLGCASDLKRTSFDRQYSSDDEQIDRLIQLLLEPTEKRWQALDVAVDSSNVRFVESHYGSSSLGVLRAERQCGVALHDRQESEYGIPDTTWQRLRSNYLTDTTYCVLVYAKLSDSLYCANLVLIMSPEVPVRYLSGTAFRCRDTEQFTYLIDVTHK
jgi:hypothetical protein